MASALSWDDLRFFLAVARAGSLSSAARSLGVAVTTVSRRIAALEEALGAQLFERSFEGLTPTDAGERCLEHAAGIEDSVLSLARDAAGQVDEVAGEVRVSTVESLAHDVIAPALPDLLARHPRLTVILRSQGRAVSLARREADLAVRLMRPQGERLIARRVGRVRFGVFAAQSYLDARGRPERPLESLAGHDLISFDERWAREPEVAWLAIRAEGARIALRTTTMRVAYAAAIAGAGIAVLPDHHGAHPALERLVPAAELPTRDVWLVFHESLRRAAHVRAVADHLAQSIASRFPT